MGEHSALDIESSALGRSVPGTGTKVPKENRMLVSDALSFHRLKDCS